MTDPWDEFVENVSALHPNGRAVVNHARASGVQLDDWAGLLLATPRTLDDIQLPQLTFVDAANQVRVFTPAGESMTEMEKGTIKTAD